LKRSKIIACILAIVLLIILWLNVVESYQKYLTIFAILGIIFASMLVVYVIVVLFITIYDEIGIKH